MHGAFIKIDGNFPSINGYKTKAIISHVKDETDNKYYNMVTFNDVFFNTADALKYSTLAPNCDHCGYNRSRNSTVILHNTDTGEEQQVGTTCLNNFIPKDFEAIFTNYNAMMETIISIQNGSNEGDDSNYEELNLKDFNYLVAVTFNIIGKHGLTPKSKSNSTASYISNYIRNYTRSLEPLSTDHSVESRERNKEIREAREMVDGYAPSIQDLDDVAIKMDKVLENLKALKASGKIDSFQTNILSTIVKFKGKHTKKVGQANGMLPWIANEYIKIGKGYRSTPGGKKASTETSSSMTLAGKVLAIIDNTVRKNGIVKGKDAGSTFDHVVRQVEGDNPLPVSEASIKSTNVKLADFINYYKIFSNSDFTDNVLDIAIKFKKSIDMNEDIPFSAIKRYLGLGVWIFGLYYKNEAQIKKFNETKF